jgi:hypothetical protein
VSPSWRDEIGVHISPRRLCMVRLRRGFKRRLTAEHEASLEAPSGGDWKPALAALEERLAQPQWQAQALRVVIADTWVRYALVPWKPNLRSAVDRAAHARQIFVSTYGDALGGWEIRLSDAPPQAARVACAIPPELLGDLRATASRHQLSLLSVTSQLLVAYATWRHCLPASGAWFVTIGDGTLAAARLGKRAWDRVHAVRIGHDWTRELKRLQTFGRLASTNPADGAVYVDAPAAWREVAGGAGQDLHWLEGQPPRADTLQHLVRLRRMGP